MWFAAYHLMDTKPSSNDRKLSQQWQTPRTSYGIQSKISSPSITCSNCIYSYPSVFSHISEHWKNVLIPFTVWSSLYANYGLYFLQNLAGYSTIFQPTISDSHSPTHPYITKIPVVQLLTFARRAEEKLKGEKIFFPLNVLLVFCMLVSSFRIKYIKERISLKGR